MKLKMVVLAPMPTASVITAMAVNPGRLNQIPERVANVASRLPSSLILSAKD